MSRTLSCVGERQVTALLLSADTEDSFQKCFKSTLHNSLFCRKRENGDQMMVQSYGNK